MKVNKLKLMGTIGALGLTAGVLAGCGQKDNDDDYVKVVDANGQVQYIEQDDYDNDGGGFFILYSNWNGHNHSKLKSGYHGKVFKSKPSTTSAKSSSGAKASSGKSVNLGKSSGVGAKASSGRSGGFGG